MGRITKMMRRMCADTMHGRSLWLWKWWGTKKKKKKKQRKRYTIIIPEQAPEGAVPEA